MVTDQLVHVDPKTGGWLKGYEYCFDAGIAEWLRIFFNGKTVSDFGCGGKAFYTRFLNILGVKTNGYDTHESVAHEENCKQLNMALDESPERTDWAMCLEVLEHIPAEYQEHALQMLDDCNREGLVISWAKPGQEGTGHYNCKPWEEVKAIFEGRGYTYDDAESMRANALSSGHYRDCGGIRIFRRLNA